MDYKQYELLTYMNDEGKEVVIPHWQQSLLKMLKACNWHHSPVLYDPIEAWTKVTPEEFNMFRLGPDYQASPNPHHL
jgi:hypothetical protein